MEKIKIADTTLTREQNSFSFKEKIEIARYLDRLCVDVIDLPEIANGKVDSLLVKTLSSIIKTPIISVCAGRTKESIDLAIEALSACKNGRIRFEIPVSVVSMEYEYHKKAPKMLEYIKENISYAKSKISDIEVCFTDATRSDMSFLKDAVKTVVDCGANNIVLSDKAGCYIPFDFSGFVKEIISGCTVPVWVDCDNTNGFAVANAVTAIKEGAKGVKTCVGNSVVSTEVFADMVKNCGKDYKFDLSIKQTEVHRTVGQIQKIIDNNQKDKSALTTSDYDTYEITLTTDDDIQAVNTAVAKLGYDVSEEDLNRIYEEFQRVVQKKNQVGAKELDTIVANISLEVPPTYKLISYVINNGNIIKASAQISLAKGEQTLYGINMGDGPIDAAFLAIEQVIGKHYELDDFQIQSVTEGKEAMGMAIVKLRANGKLYSGSGLSTDIIGASVRAYISAVNKIVYEEENA